MPTVTQKHLFSTQNIQRAVWIVFALVIISLLLFSGYYYWDRYVVRLGDKSPLELNIEHLEQAIRDNPEDPEMRVALAEYYLDQGLPQEALSQAGQVLNVYPDNEGAMLISGIAYVRLDQPEAALEPLEQFASIRKEGPMAKADTTLEMAYYFLGESYVKQGRPAAAVSVLQEALAINATDADALYQLGQAYQADGQPSAALEQYHQAVRFVPDFTEAYSGMIESYTTLDQPDYVAYARGMQAFTLGDYKTAQTHLEFSSQALPEFSPAFLGLGLTYEKLGRLDDALVAINKTLELNPDDYAGRQASGRIQAMLDSEG